MEDLAQQGVQEVTSNDLTAVIMMLQMWLLGKDIMKDMTDNIINLREDKSSDLADVMNTDHKRQWTFFFLSFFLLSMVLNKKRTVKQSSQFSIMPLGHIPVHN
jgi:high-affinity Fe2+/Pb2+ permease